MNRQYSSVDFNKNQKAINVIASTTHKFEGLQLEKDKPSTLMEHIKGTPTNKYINAKNKFVEKLRRVQSCFSEFAGKFDFAFMENTSYNHCVVKAREALASLTCSDPVVIGFIADAIKAADALLMIPEPPQVNAAAENTIEGR